MTKIHNTADEHKPQISKANTNVGKLLLCYNKHREKRYEQKAKQQNK